MALCSLPFARELMAIAIALASAWFACSLCIGMVCQALGFVSVLVHDASLDSLDSLVIFFGQKPSSSTTIATLQLII